MILVGEESVRGQGCDGAGAQQSEMLEQQRTYVLIPSAESHNASAAFAVELAAAEELAACVTARAEMFVKDHSDSSTTPKTAK